MSQIRILEFLEENSQCWLSASEICIGCGVNLCNGMKSLKKMREYSEVKYKSIKADRNQRYLYRYKRMREII